MNALINPQPFHFREPASRLSPPRFGGKKRKADEDDDSEDHQMVSSPSSPNMLSRQAASHRINKRQRSDVTGRPLPLARLLETVDSNTLKAILQTICDRHPELLEEVSSLAPRPTVISALSTLNNYEAAVRAAFPYGGNSGADYAFNRVKTALNDLLDALSDYTPHFLPPNESQSTTSLTFLDDATNIIHRLPNWDNPVHNHSKNMAYEEITKAWVLVVQEAAKRGAGIQLEYGGWGSKLARHVEQSEGRMQMALIQMRQALGYSDYGKEVNKLGGRGFNMHSSGVQVPVRSW
ncbi:Tethering factor for nuclear proteasome sts1 [Maublancomyces gigas]|uniref:Tethering factor for nuclear proteasome STS1 n=1 Tax=Discina gigas TaxID=1032678 RepID=A0ABR3GRI3_9PEZI